MNYVTEAARIAVQRNTDISNLPRDQFLAAVRNNLVAQGYREVMSDVWQAGGIRLDLNVQRAVCEGYEHTFDFSDIDELLYIVSDQSGAVLLPDDCWMIEAAGWRKVESGYSALPKPYAVWERDGDKLTFNLIDRTWALNNEQSHKYVALALNNRCVH